MYIPLLIYSLWEAVPLTVYGKPYALGLGKTKYSLPGYKHLYPGPHMCATVAQKIAPMFACYGKTHTLLNDYIRQKFDYIREQSMT